MAYVIPIAILLAACSGKHSDSGQADASSDPAPNEAVAPGPKVPVMAITYQTQITANQISHPPGTMIPATRGREIRYLDLANNRMRLEKYVFEGSKQKLYETTIINQTGSYRLDAEKHEAFFTKMTTSNAVWNFDENVSVAWARQVNLTVGQEQFLNRTCDVVHMASAGNVWFWNEIPLKKELKTVTSEISVEAYQIQEDASIGESLLQVPSEMKIISGG